MKQFKFWKIFIAFFLLTSFHQTERNKYIVEITFRNWLDQPFVRYSLNEKSIKVETSDYNSFAKTKVVYTRNLSNHTSDSIYTYLSKLDIDTTKANCNNPVLDGLWIDYNIKGQNIKSVHFITHSCITNKSSDLIKLAERQILKKQFTYTEIKTTSNNNE